MSAPGLGTPRRVVWAIEYDDEGYFLIRSALMELGSGLDVQRVKTREDALQSLRRASSHKQGKPPKLVIVDVTSSVRDGWSLVSEIRKDVGLQSIPVVVVGPEPASHLGPIASDVRFYIDKSVSRDTFTQQVKESCLFAMWLSAT